MFSRRKRSQSNPPLTSANANPAATTAATQAFLARKPSSASLSSAAAAAALRASATTPTPVGEVQTKRTIRRNGSKGSLVGSVSSPPPLQRRGSSGSMTERSFRSPSPSRDSVRGASIEDAPPVPALPKDVPAVPKKSARRAASVEVQQRLSSPPPKRAGRGIGLDRSPKGKQLNNVAELERSDSRASVNFSYPIKSPPGSRPTSPPAVRSPVPVRSPQRPTSPLSNQAATTAALKSNEVSNIKYHVQEAANSPVKKKKKATSRDAEGSHLAHGTSGAKPTGTAVDGGTHSQNADASRSKAAPLTAPNTSAPRRTKKVPSDQSGSDISDPESTSGVSSPDRPKSISARATGVLAKQPSIVREDREREEEEERKERAATLRKLESGDPTSPTSTISSLDAPAPRTTNGHVKQRPLKPQADPAKQHTRSASQPAPTIASSLAIPSEPLPSVENKYGSLGRGSSSARGARPQSLSPSRSAHFSSVTVLGDTIHQPPPRSVSPAKSAMKHSPSQRGISPAGKVKGATLAPSEASDNTSLMSEEGVSPAAKKKSARVSFDENSVVLGRATSPPTSPDTPVLASPQNKESGKGWFGIGRKKGQENAAASPIHEEEDVLTPRPALPMFGSVRARKDKGENEDHPSKVTETLPQQPTIQPEVMHASSDHVVGAVLQQDFASKTTSEPAASLEHPAAVAVLDSNTPLPPEVTTVEGTGYVSDTDSMVSVEEVHKVVAVEAKPEQAIEEDAQPKTTAVWYTEPSPETLARIAEMSPEEEATETVEPKTNGHIPSINILQPTPDLERAAHEWAWSVPGSFPEDEPTRRDPHSTTTVTPSPPLPIDQHSPAETPATLGLAEPDPVHIPTNTQGLPIVGEIADNIRHQTHTSDEEESGSEIFSDAAEDLSDLEGDGFGSINAIVESPIVGPLPGAALTTPPDSPISKTATSKTYQKSKLSRQDSEISEPPPEAGWDQAQAYWSSLSERRKMEIEQQYGSGGDDEASPIERKPRKKKAVKKNTGEVTSSVTAPSLQAPRTRQAIGVPRSDSPSKSKPILRNSMRAPQPDPDTETHMRKTMRTGNMRTSMRGPPPEREPPESPSPPPKGILKQKARPVSMQASPTNIQSAAARTSHMRSKSSSNAPTAPIIPSSLGRTMSNGSDSSSSFKKRRTSTSGSGYTMKRTMRGRSEAPASPEPASQPRSSRFSIRSLSPTGSAFGRKAYNSPDAGPTLRSSMRDTSTPTLRNKQTKSPSRSLFSISSKSKPEPPPKKASRFSSRFGDSSDEEGGGVQTFRSRFADSSDEDEPDIPPIPSKYTPVRGIPRPAGRDDGDSTDLPDSDEEGRKSTKKPPVPAIPDTSRPLGPGRTATNTTSITAVSQSSKKKRSLFNPLGKRRESSHTIRKSELESPMRRDTPLERSTSEIRALHANDPSKLKQPKLQRRNTPDWVKAAQADDGEAWPLPKMSGVDADRPGSADNMVVSGALSGDRPAIGMRRSTTPNPGEMLALSDGRVVSDGRKKKKFPGLRKFFGLND